MQGKPAVTPESENDDGHGRAKKNEYGAAVRWSALRCLGNSTLISGERVLGLTCGESLRRAGHLSRVVKQVTPNSMNKCATLTKK